MGSEEKISASKCAPLTARRRRRANIAAAIAVLLFLAALTGCQSVEKMLFPTPHTGVMTGNVSLRSGDAVIDAFYCPPPENRPVILYSHGNYQYLAQLDPMISEMISRNYGVLAYDYAGYGGSTGRAGEAQSCLDIVAAWCYLTENQKISPERIIVFGFSVGTGPSCHLAAHHRVGALVLAAPFASACQVVLPFYLPLFDRFDNAGLVAELDIPVLVFHGIDDTVIPFRNGRKVYDRAREPKKLVAVPGADHNDLFAVLGETFWLELENFAAAKLR